MFFGVDPPVYLGTDVPIGEIQPGSPEELKQRMDFIIGQVREARLESQAKQMEAQPSRYSHEGFQVGDKVYVVKQCFAKQVQDGNPDLTSKTEPLYFGPFKVKARYGQLHYDLDLPDGLRGSDLFHLTQLKPAPPATDEDQQRPPAPPAVVDPVQGDVYKIARVIRSRGRGRQRQHLVAWEGYGPDEYSWISDAQLKQGTAALNKATRTPKPRKPKAAPATTQPKPPSRPRTTRTSRAAASSDKDRSSIL